MMQKPPLSTQLQMETRLRIYLHIRAHNSSIIPMDRRWKHSKSPMRMLEAKVHRRSTEHALTSSYSVHELRNANHKKTHVPWFYVYQAPDVSKSTGRRTAVVPGAAGRRTGRVTASRHRKNPADCLPSNAEWLRWELKSTGCSPGGPGVDSWHLHGSSPPSVAPAPGSHDGFWHNPQALGIQAVHKHTCRLNSQHMK